MSIPVLSRPNHPKDQVGVLYEAAALGIAHGRLGRCFTDREPQERQPTELERLWGRLAVDALLPFLSYSDEDAGKVYGDD